MSNNPHHQIVHDFFAAIASGSLGDDLLTTTMTAWTLSGGDMDRARFTGGVKVMAAAVEGDLHYDILSVTADNEHAVAEVTSDWPLINGQRAQNRHVFVLTLSDGKIAHVSEYMDPRVPREILGPLIQQMMQQEG